MDKAQSAIELLRAQLPPCCRKHHVPRGAEHARPTPLEVESATNVGGQLPQGS
jgi:hypothetical protein